MVRVLFIDGCISLSFTFCEKFLKCILRTSTTRLVSSILQFFSAVASLQQRLFFIILVLCICICICICIMPNIMNFLCCLIDSTDFG